MRRDMIIRSFKEWLCEYDAWLEECAYNPMRFVVGENPLHRAFSHVMVVLECIMFVSLMYIIFGIIFK